MGMTSIGLTHATFSGKPILMPNWQHNCVCCGRTLGLPNGDRGLCDACEEDIPNHIPKEQYLTYMKELWRIK
jgi:hypothetical protein